MAMTRWIAAPLLLLLRCEAGLAVASTDCAPACGAHGTCRSGVCECEVGWAGKGCGFFLAEEESHAEEKPPHVALNPAVLHLLEQAVSASTGAPQMEAAHADPKGAAIAAHAETASPEGGATATGAIQVAREAVLQVTRTAELLEPSQLRGSGVANAALLQKPEAAKAAKCEADCSGHGKCKESGACECSAGWTGSLCDMPLCPSNCNDRGLCIHSRCLCEEGWHGAACHIKRCPNDCSGAGYCFHGKCKCNEGFDGPDCTTVVEGRQSVVVKLRRSDPTEQQQRPVEVQGVPKFTYGEEGPWALPTPAFPW